MTKTTKTTSSTRELRFYVCLLLGFTLMMCGFFAPPMGEIHNSVLVGAGLLLSIGALAVGIDLVGCIHELRLLRSGTTDDLNTGSPQASA